MSSSSEPSAQDSYQSILGSRYCRSSALLPLFSERKRIETWRQLWTWLAQAQMQLKVADIKQEQVAAMQASIGDIDWKFARERESECRHDVMAHIATFEQACPLAKGIIHLGATSCFVTDNGDLMILRSALQHIRQKLALTIHRLAQFADKYKDTCTVGRTHYQPASITTVGKRAAMWIESLLFAHRSLANALAELRCRGCKGATGTQDSFMTLCSGDEEKVKQLDARVSELAGFTQTFIVTGQTYDRMIDVKVISALSELAAGLHSICMDLRMSQANGELREPFEAQQVGSSAMPYKRNPMRAERCCGLARYLMSLPANALNTVATQSIRGDAVASLSICLASDKCVEGFERTLDDSSNRRIVLPDAFLTADAALATFQNIVEGLQVIESTTQAHVAQELPFLALEKVLMRLTQTGCSRQTAHEHIRTVSLAAHAKREEGETVHLMDMLSEDVLFEPVLQYAAQLTTDPLCFAGRSSAQVTEFIRLEVTPALAEFTQLDTKDKAKLDI